MPWPPPSSRWTGGRTRPASRPPSRRSARTGAVATGSLVGGTDLGPERRALLRHASRTLIKQGHAGVYADAPAGTTTHSVKGTLNMHGVEKEVTIPVKTTVSK